MDISISLLIMVVLGFFIGRFLYWSKHPNLNRRFSDWQVEAFGNGVLFALIFAGIWAAFHYSLFSILWHHITFKL